MNYIILAAGIGSRLHPFTKECPKCMFQIGNNETVAQRMIRLIRKLDATANIIYVLGYRKKEIEENIKGNDIVIVYNPFYNTTNSIASLWFAQEYLNDDTFIINGDIILSENILKIVLYNKLDDCIFLDSSIKKDGDYNVQVNDKKVVVMSKELKEYYGEYAGVTYLNKSSTLKLKDQINDLIDNGYYNEWYENALVYMILNSDFKLSYFDLADYDWAELDTVNDLLMAKEIQRKEVK